MCVRLQNDSFFYHQQKRFSVEPFQMLKPLTSQRTPEEPDLRVSLQCKIVKETFRHQTRLESIGNIRYLLPMLALRDHLKGATWNL